MKKIASTLSLSETLCVDCVVYLSDFVLIMDTKNALQHSVYNVCVLIFKLDDKCSTRHMNRDGVDDKNEIKKLNF